jgi:hypothetical protein
VATAAAGASEPHCRSSTPEAWSVWGDQGVQVQLAALCRLGRGSCLGYMPVTRDCLPRSRPSIALQIKRSSAADERHRLELQQAPESNAPQVDLHVCPWDPCDSTYAIDTVALQVLARCTQARRALCAHVLLADLPLQKSAVCRFVLFIGSVITICTRITSQARRPAAWERHRSPESCRPVGGPPHHKMSRLGAGEAQNRCQLLMARV